ncbi:uncharacterized protein LOC134753711 [Cydia strobilella]|uniref:uncharacterized protein LOC134753711 n=1 Tax=Cydia strobilella TaxID=1100964 RepID=UPI003005303F
MLEQKEKEKVIELACVDEVEHEKLDEVVASIAQKLDLNTEDIEQVRRVGAPKKKVDAEHGDKQARARPIVVTMRTKAARDQWINKRKTRLTKGEVKGRSTATALTQFSNYVNKSLGGGQQVIALFIDYKKAFDTLDHEQLLQAMDECGIRGPTNQWFREYLNNRTLRTAINGESGSDAHVTLGVPTGSVYGPVGYIMHVNSVSNVVQNCTVYMYADDMCLLFAGKDVRTW